VKIVLIADTHLAADAVDFNANTAAALAWAGEIGADMIVHLGDITADGAEHVEQFDAAHDVLAKAVTPMRLVPGNHDIGDSPNAAAHGRVDPERLALYRQRFGPDRWSMVAEGWMLIGLNAQLFAMGDSEEAAQFEWLEAALAAWSGPVGVFLHKPLFRDGWEDTDPHPRYVPLPPRRRLQAMLAGCDLRFVVNGHTHQHRCMSVVGVDHVWAPSCAFIVPDAMQEWIGEKVVGAMTLMLAADSHEFAFHRPPGVAYRNLASYADLFPKVRKALAGADSANGG
jgi:3',5'-cyclic AMP phosphodiesterase CpdA